MTNAEAMPILSLRQYTQMTVNESMIARAWFMKHWPEIDSIDFNHHVGNSISLPPGTDDVTRAQAEKLYKKRADFIAWHAQDATIVEVKPRLSLSALGQLLGYQLLFQLEHPEVKTVHLVAIGHSASVDTAQVLMAHGVAVELFPNVTLLGAQFGNP